jgi:hypothetical protein
MATGTARLEHLRLSDFCCFTEREKLGIVCGTPIRIRNSFNEWLNHRTAFSDKLWRNRLIRFPLTTVTVCLLLQAFLRSIVPRQRPRNNY